MMGGLWMHDGVELFQHRLPPVCPAARSFFLLLAKLSRCLQMLLEEWSPTAPRGSTGPHSDEEVAVVRKVRGRPVPCRRAAEEEE